jgi:hypothetical protein
VLLAAVLLPACGGGNDTPPPAAPPPTASALDFTLVPMINQATVVEFRWSGANASGYRLLIGSSSGGSDVATFETTATSYAWTGVPIGTFYARVRGLQGAVLGASSNEVVVASIDFRQMTDALIFGRGPLAVAGNAAAPHLGDQMDGWQPGSTFDVTVGESVSAAFVTTIENTVKQVGPATRGAVQATFEGKRPDPLATPRPGEVTIAMLTVDQLKDECECTDCVGCAFSWYLGAFTTRARIVASPRADSSTPAHELGHVIGLAHVISATGVRPPFTMGVTTDGMFSPRGQIDALDPATVRMLQAIYDAGLGAGASHREFEAAGLVPPPAAGAAQGEEVPLPPGYLVRRDGIETMVRRPLCAVRIPER